MSNAYLKIKDGQKLLGTSVVRHSNGNDLVVEIAQTGPSATVVAFTEVSPDPKFAPRTMCYGYCDGVFIGSIDCPHNDPFVDCVNKRISCDS